MASSLYPSRPSGGINQLTGNVTAGPGTGSQVATIPPGVITAAQLADISSARVLGRDTAGVGSVEVLTLSEVLDLIGSAARGDILYRGAANWERLAKGTAGHYLTIGANDPAWAAVASGGRQVKIKQAGQTRQNDTLTNDTELFFAAEANKIYFIELTLQLQAVLGSTADWKIDFVIPALATFRYAADWQASVPFLSVTATTVTPGTLPSAGTPLAFGGANSSVVTAARFKGFFINGANAGNFQLQWAQNTTNASDSIVMAGSCLAYQAQP